MILIDNTFLIDTLRKKSDIKSFLSPVVKIFNYLVFSDAFKFQNLVKGKFI